MELKILEPPVACYLHHAYPLTVAMSHKDFDSWFFSNYIQLEYSFTSDMLNFFTYVICGNSIYNTLIDYRILDLELIYKTNINIIDFICLSIENGYYVTTYADELYIPERLNYKKQHFRHDIMVYGFDKNNSQLKTMGYNGTGTYKSTDVSFSEFEESYLNSIDKKNDFILMKAKDSASYCPSYKFDIENVKNLLYDYLHSKNSSERLRSIGNPNKFVYGLSVYNQLVSIYEEILIDDKKECDLRHFQLLYEHKKNMIARIEYLTEKGYINNKEDLVLLFSDLQKAAKNARNTSIKYNLTKNKMLINMIIDTLKKMQEKDAIAVKALFESIKSDSEPKN